MAVVADEEQLALEVAKAMRAEMGRIDKMPARQWHDADPKNQKIWLRLARTAIKTIYHADEATTTIGTPDGKV